MTHLPKHIVLFPDGNRRWAKAHGISISDGYLKGKDKFNEFLHWCKESGVQVVTVFGFSSENWKRPQDQVDFLMHVFEKYLGGGIENFNNEGVRVKVIGQKHKLSDSLKTVIEKVQEATAGNTAMHLNLAVSYGGRWDIVNAVKEIIKQGIDPEMLTEDLFASYLSTAGLPEPDLIIRAGGEMRLSNFVLWQGAYSELYFSDKLWPDFSKEDFQVALQEFDSRQRRYGK
ncbi:MAG TPA: polyprenyl diphosphate synthase [Negativicutes bacterium]|nr:MAG: di-trans,poly-cis-decaprenylcistransferase [Candidatus Staskawiczbacteria bacterium RIFCSPLOWO2_01_FULL_43_17b]HLD70272.1 polyprenyl diphosphate synthase [Negativicutes bacterium]